MADADHNPFLALLSSLSEPDPQCQREDLLAILTSLQDQATQAQLSPDITGAFLEAGIKEAIALGGRVNAVDLLAINSLIARGALPPSPALATWLADGVQAILDGATADDAFGIRRKQGPDPLEYRDNPIEIHKRVTAARKQGYKTQPNRGQPSCFEVVAEELGGDEATVRKTFYTWKVIEDIQFPRPPGWPADLPWPPPSK